MTDENSVHAISLGNIGFFSTDGHGHDAETDNSGTDRASSPEIRPSRLGLRNTFATMDSPLNRGSSSSTIRLGVDGNQSIRPFRSFSSRHGDIFLGVPEIDDENDADSYAIHPFFLPIASRGSRSYPRWFSSAETLLGHPSTNISTDDYFDRLFDRLRVTDSTVETDVYPEVVSEATEPGEFEESASQRDWRTTCKGVQDRLRSVLSSERFADVYFYVAERIEEEVSKSCKRTNRSNSILSSSRPPAYPKSKHSSASAQRRQNMEEQRKITFAIAQVSGNASAVLQASPAASDTEDGESESRVREATAAKALTEMLLAMRNTTNTPEVLSPLLSSDSSSPSEDSAYLNGTTNIAVMCQLSDTSDIDGIAGEGIGDVNTDLNSACSEQQSIAEEADHIEVKRFAAHRLVLAIASPVFEAMFFGSFAEGATKIAKSSAGAMELQVSDVTAQAFQQCLRYIYHDDLTLTDTLNDLYDTLYAAKKYFLTPLAAACTIRLINLMTSQNVLLQLNRCSAMDEQELFEICWHTIDVLTPEVLTSERFVDLERETLFKLISRETLYCEEWEIFEALMRWSKVECTRAGDKVSVADVMKDFLPYIRFTTMSLEDFIIHVSKADILSLEVQHNILLQIATKIFGNTPGNVTTERTNCIDDGETGTNARKRRGPPVLKCRRFTQSVTPTGKEAYWSDTEHIVFQVSKPVFLVGVGLFGPMNKEAHLKVSVELRQCSLSQSSKVSSSGGGFALNYRNTGASTQANSSGNGHRHGQRHVGIQHQSYLRSSTENGRRRGHGNAVRSRSGQTPESLSTPLITSPRILFKSVKVRGGALGALEMTLNCSQSTNRIVEARFSRPIKLKRTQYYLLSVTPEEGRNARCYHGAAPARSHVSVQTNLPSTSAALGPINTSRLVNFDFAFNGIGVGSDVIGGGGDGDKHLVGTLGTVSQGLHVPQFLFFPIY